MSGLISIVIAVCAIVATLTATSTRRRQKMAPSARGGGGASASARACATRIGLEALDSFEVHFFESDVTPAGPVPVASWARYWRALHGGFAGRSRADAWDQVRRGTFPL